jgi:hypothetical protein
LCALMNKYKKKNCYNYMPSFTDEALDSDGDAEKVKTTEKPNNFIRLNENRSWKLMWTR